MNWNNEGYLIDYTETNPEYPQHNICEQVNFNAVGRIKFYSWVENAPNPLPETVAIWRKKEDK